MTVLWSGQPADYQDDELELVDDYDPEIDLLDDLCDWDEDWARRPITSATLEGHQAIKTSHMKLIRQASKR